MGKSHLRSALVLGAIAALLVAAVPANAEPEHPVGLERAAEVHARNAERHGDRDDHKSAPQPPTVVVVHDPAPAPIVIHDPAPAPITIVVNVPAYAGPGTPVDSPSSSASSSSASSSASSSNAGSGGSGGTVSDDSGRLAVCHYEPATVPKLEGGVLVPGTPAGFQIRFLFRYQVDQYVNATSPDYFSVTGDCGPLSNPAIV